MRLSVAFKNELFGSHEWCGGFPFIPLSSSGKGHLSALNPGSSQWLQHAVLIAQHILKSATQRLNSVAQPPVASVIFIDCITFAAAFMSKRYSSWQNYQRLSVTGCS